MKQFLKWIELKERLHDRGRKHLKIPRVHEGDIWWACLGENIGAEINGKSDLFSRPVIILKHLAPGFYFVIPATSQRKDGSWYVPFASSGKQAYACLQQSRSIDYRRLVSKLGALSVVDFLLVKTGFHVLYR